MKNFYDMIVIGSGPGGQRAALAASKAGKHVCIIEREKLLGGACVHKGTIPSKTLREAALTLAKLKRSAQVFEFSLRKDLEVATLINRMNTVVTNYTNVLHDDLNKNHVDILKGRAKIRDPQTVSVQAIDGRTHYIQGQNIIIATGSSPRHPDGIGIDHENILDSDSILSMIYLPESLTVLGGGVIGSEYASIFSMLGVKVTLIDAAPRPLMFMDPEITEKLIKTFVDNGSIYLGNQVVKSVVWDNISSVVVELESGEIIKSEKMLVASGRVANVKDLGLQEINMQQTSRGHIIVDENFETSIPRIYAVGDVIGHPSLASCSMEQGRRAAGNSLGMYSGVPFEFVPIGIYAVPEMSSVGIDEETAIKRFGKDEILVGRADFNQVARGQIMGIKDGLLKLIALNKSKKLLGVHIVGEGATELIHMGELALINQNSVKVFLENVLNFPTLAEAYRIAALDLMGGRY